MSIFLPLKVTPGKPVLRGFDFLWQQIREAGKKGRHFTAKEIDLAGNDRNRCSASHYLRRLQAAGYVVEVARKAPRRPGIAAGQAIYQLVRRPAETPHIRLDGSLALQGDGQTRMWNAIRTLKSFDHAEIAIAASIEGGAVTHGTAKTYVRHLAAAGYLAALTKGGPGKATVWRLKPSMNTGPKPPLVLRTKLVYDPNRNAVMGPVVAEEGQP